MRLIGKVFDAIEEVFNGWPDGVMTAALLLAAVLTAGVALFGDKPTKLATALYVFLP